MNVHKRKLPFLIPTLSLFFVTLTFQSVKGQLGASSLNAPGIAVNVDYLPASRYIRPEDSLKTQSTSTVMRYSMGAAFQLYKRVDTATGKFRLWTMGVTGSYMKFENKKYEKRVMPEELFGGDITLQYMRNLKNRWSLMGVLSAGIYTDKEQIDYNDIFLNGGVLFIKQRNAHFSYGFGAMLTNAFGTPMVLPGMMVQWKTGKKLNVEIIVPEKLKVSYKLTDYFETGIAARMNGGSYDVEYAGKNQRLMGYREMTGAWENTLHLNKKVSFSVAGGAALLRSVDYRKKSLSEMFKTLPEHKLATNWFVSAGIRVHFHEQQ